MKKKWISWLIPALITAAVILLFRFVFILGYVPTPSMEPTLPEGSLIVGVRVFSEPEVGDILIFRHDGKLLVKRVAACEGESIFWQEKELTVPEGCFYMLGDNADESFDSRYWEEPFIRLDEIVARVVIP